MAGYSTATGNRMTNDGVYTYTYDDEGNITKKSKGAADETWTYSYDNDNHLTGVTKRTTDGGGTLQMQATYVYDALSNRIEKQVYDGVATTTSRFSYDGSDIWADLDSGSSLTTRYLRGDGIDDHVARVTSGGTVSWLLADRLGSVRNVVDANGSLIATIAYSATGKVTTESSAANSGRFGFTGRERDTETGLNFHRQRYYDPETSKWWSEDHIWDSTNPYEYVRNSPTNFTDPSGLAWYHTASAWTVNKLQSGVRAAADFVGVEQRAETAANFMRSQLNRADQALGIQPRAEAAHTYLSSAPVINRIEGTQIIATGLLESMTIASAPVGVMDVFAGTKQLLSGERHESMLDAGARRVFGDDHGPPLANALRAILASAPGPAPATPPPNAPPRAPGPGGKIGQNARANPPGNPPKPPLEPGAVPAVQPRVEPADTASGKAAGQCGRLWRAWRWYWKR